MIDSLISASILNNDISYVERVPMFLLNETEKNMVKWLKEYKKKHGRTPTPERFEKTPFGIYFTKSLTSSPLSDLFEGALKTKQAELFLKTFSEMEEIIDDGDDLPLNRLNDLARQLANVMTKPSASILDYNRDELYEGDDNDALMVGMDIIDDIYGGIHPGEFVVIAARVGVGKSMVLCLLAVLLARKGHRVGLFSREMSQRELVSRIDSILGQFNPMELRKKTNKPLLKAKKKEVEEELAKISLSGGNIIIPREGAYTPSAIRGFIRDEKPDIVLVDGIYLMRPDENINGADWQKLKAISNELKNVAMEESARIIGTTQLKRTGKDDGYDLEDLAYSDSIGQDADLVIAGSRPKGMSINQSLWTIIKNRHGSGYGSNEIKIDYNTMSFTQSEWDEDKSLTARTKTKPTAYIGEYSVLDDDDELEANVSSEFGEGIEELPYLKVVNKEEVAKKKKKRALVEELELEKPLKNH